MPTTPPFSFNYSNPVKENRARLGKLETPHGTIETPSFIFCATKASIKGVTPYQMKSAGTQFMLANTYHLMIQPGAEVVAATGGLHNFMGWDGPLLTDSGGFQIFSLGHGSVAEEIKGNRQSNRPRTMLKITEEGAKFKSYLDGAIHVLTPEKAMEIQRLLGPDFVVVLDECTPFHVDKRYTERSMHLSHRWEKRSLAAFQEHDNGKQKIYGIIQGGVHEDLRQQSCDFVNEHAFFGHAIGGSLGATKEQMYDVVSFTASNLCENRPIHLLGIGGIRDIFHGVSVGIDTFDCVHPTRLARHGGALVKAAIETQSKREHINLRNSQYRLDQSPIDPTCGCETCLTSSRSYIHHLLKAQELLAYTLITIHNVYHMNSLLAAIRGAIAKGTLDAEKKIWVKD